MNGLIPVYRAGGELYDRVTEAQSRRLQKRGLVARVIKHRKGHVNRAILFALPGEQPLRPTAYIGTRYSFLERLAHGFCWDLRRLGGGRHGLTYAPEEVRPIFMRVLLECLQHV